jgi:NADH-quinone oxidoreductase subunit C
MSLDEGVGAAEEAEPEAEPTIEVELAYGVPVSTSHGQAVLHPSRDQLVDTVTALRSDGFLMCIDHCGVDYLTHPGRTLPAGVEPGRYEVVVGLLDTAARRRIRLRVQIPADDPTCPTLFTVHPGTEALERETFDMYGIVFDGHPDMTRILMPDDWVGHPLRKDYSVGRIPVQFKGAPS